VTDLWVFGYGSLMWRPGFAFDEAVPAQLYSVVHRGTPRHPGLVLGLDAGGRCDGIAFRIRPGHERRTRVYLKGREQVTRVYREVMRPVTLADAGASQVRALCFLVDSTHPQYAGKLPITEQARLVRRGRGRSGANTDYVANTVSHLAELGFDEPTLRRLMPLLGIRNTALQARPSERDTSLEC
jgi:cation transport protein ChaC